MIKRFRWPKTVIARFVARRSLKSATVWAFIFGAYTADKTIAYAKAFPTTAQRLKLAHDFGGNVGLEALLGQPRHIETVAGYAAWNTLMTVTIVGSIWGYLLATKYFRGEEESGRSEYLLVGQTTARGAALKTIIGLRASLLVLYVIVAAMFVAIGKSHMVGFSTGQALFFALASVSGAAFFMSVGALTSQLMPTRSQASGLAAVIFGVAFLLRAMGDITKMHWLLYLTPIGWIEKLQPLTNSQPIWLLPIFGGIAILGMLTVWLAGRRDFGDSLVADKDSPKPKFGLLNSPLLAAVRLTRAASFGWLLATALGGLFYGVLTNAATQAFKQTGAAQKVINKLTQTSHLAASTLYLGIVFFILMTVIMAHVASAMGKVREDEAQGYLDNFLVRPVSRQQWLWGRLGLITVLTLAACFFGALGTWVGQVSQHTGVSLHSLLIAGANMAAPAIFTLGAAVLVFGLRPRLTSLAAYGVLGWSFIVSLASSGASLNHWFLDTSVLHHMNFAPATNPNWTTNSVMIALGLGLCVIGALAFNSRDLANE